MISQELPLPAEHPLEVLRAARAMRNETGACVLIFISNTEGGAMRAPGAVMAVSGDGGTAGYLSAGCIDSDVKIHALRAIDSGHPVRLRYGQGSPFMDIQLPCGGAIDLIVCPHPAPETLNWAIQHLEDRIEARLTLNTCDGLMPDLSTPTVAEKDIFRICYPPPLKVRIAGHGADCLALARLCHASGFLTVIQTPSDDIIDYSSNAISSQLKIEKLTALTPSNSHSDDHWTAFVLLFHQHEWEELLLRQALSGPAFYIGAVGSRRTHEMRCEKLRSEGYSNAEISRIHGPIGLVPRMRDASMLAVSTLAEIVQAYQSQTS